MKTIIISDLHIGQYWKSNNSRFSRARKLIYYLKKNLEFFIGYYGTDTNLIIAGDVYDAVSANTEMLVYVANELSSTLSKFRHIYAIAGNHEVFLDREGKQQSLLTIGLQGSNVTVYNSGIHRADGTINAQYNYVFMPYQSNIEEMFMDGVIDKYLSTDTENIIVAHMTPNEIFSFNKFHMSDFIDKYCLTYKIPYIMLGHYHMPMLYRHNSTGIVSIGNTYYSTILDVRSHDSIILGKRFILVDEDGEIHTGRLIVPTIKSYSVLNQDDFDSIVHIIEREVDSNDIGTAIYLTSKTLIDYSRLMTNGYDVYFDLLEDANDKQSPLLSLNETTDMNSIKDSISGATLQERWNHYVDSLVNLDDSCKEMCRYLFSKRNDADLTSDVVTSKLKEVILGTERAKSNE